MTSDAHSELRDRLVARVEADLEHGHTHLAASRLNTWLERNPTDLDVRRRLGAVHHATGNWAQAGRWGFFAEDADPRDVAAFERAFPAAAARRRALRWPDTTTTPSHVEGRLSAIEDLPTRRARDADLRSSRTHGRVRDLVGGLGCLVGVLALGTVFVVGAVSVVRWLFS